VEVIGGGIGTSSTHDGEGLATLVVVVVEVVVGGGGG